MTHGRATLHGRILEHARVHPDAPFANVRRPSGHQALSYGELASSSSSLASGLHARGVAKGDVIAVFLPQRVESFPLFVAALRRGAVPTFFPLPSTKQNPTVFWESHRRALEKLAPHTIVTDFQHAPMLAARMPEWAERLVSVEQLPSSEAAPPAPQVSADDIALLQHSSGTTGLKKGVALSHRAVLAQLDSYGERLAMTADDRVVTWLPYYHDMGLVACFLLPAAYGASIHCLDPFEWVVRPASFLETVEAARGTLAWFPNFAFHHVVRTLRDGETFRLESLRALIDCSEPCTPEALERFRTAFSSMGLRSEVPQVSYALAENVFAVTQTTLGARPRVLAVDRDELATGVVVSPREARRARELLSCGTPIRGANVVVRGTDGSTLPEDHVGEIVVSGTSLFGGYRGAPPVAPDGHPTRDLGFFHDGELYVLGRRDDLLVIHGHNVYAHDVENAVNSYASVKPGRCIALGVWNEGIGSHDLVVVIETEVGWDARQNREIASVVEGEVGAQVSAIRLVQPGWLVKTTSGKIERARNLAKYLEPA